jgi:hypothetical protein
MSRVTILKLSLALSAVIAFALAIRTGDEMLRLVAIGLLVAAFLLRLIERGKRRG